MSNSLNLQEINQEECLNLTKFFIQNQQNVFIFGSIGTGKTALSIEAIKDLKYKVNYLNLSVLDKYDFVGLPLLNNSDTVEYRSPHFLPKLKENEKPDTVILFDEIDKVSPEITAPLLELLLYRTINGKPINAVSCILTGNLPSDNAFSQQISSALLDRGAKFVLQFDFNKWLEWAKTNNVNDLILGFLQSNTNFISSASNLESSFASQSPRGWTLASEALSKAKELKMTDTNTTYQIVSGYVGKEAGLRFKLWYEHYRQFEVHIYSLIEHGSMQLDFTNLAPTEKVVFVISACYYAKQKLVSKKKLIYVERLCQFFKSNKVDLELQLLGLHNSFSFDMVQQYKLYSCKPFFDLFAKLSQQLNFIK